MNGDACSQEQLACLAKSYGIRLLLLFGSAASGREHPRSDMDVGVLLENPELSYPARAALQYAIQGLFPEREVDLAVMNRADPLFLKKIAEHCQLLYGEASELYALKIYAFRRYQDHKLFLEMERRYIKSFLARIASRP